MRDDAATETRTQMDHATPPRVEVSPSPEAVGRSKSDELIYRLRQQSLLAHFGEVALRERDPNALLVSACQLCAEGLETPYAKVLTFDAESDRLILVAGVGWNTAAQGVTSFNIAMDSPAGYAFRTGRPLVSNHLKNEDRFSTPPLLVEHNIQRAINVLVRPEIEGDPWGVLEVDSADPGQFDSRDALFLDAFAAVVGAAIARQTTEKKLVAAIEHQALLTREVSHRVKNSLALVSSLLTMQARGSQSEDVKSALADAGARIQAIGEVHDQLWRGSDVQSVQLSDFLCQLCENLDAGSPAHTVHCHADAKALSADVAVPLGLIINELVTNAIKYAYGAEGGEILVGGRIEAGRLQVEVTDHGKGFDLAGARSERSLGMRVIDSLVRQIGGTLSNLPDGAGARLVVEAPITSL